MPPSVAAEASATDVASTGAAAPATDAAAAAPAPDASEPAPAAAPIQPSQVIGFPFNFLLPTIYEKPVRAARSLVSALESRALKNKFDFDSHTDPEDRVKRALYERIWA
ncbi:hypothetical protein K435DRAFT_867046 [Dendrothele bispora CBS 962.96]|uniref:Uncharacterized protein n=1 Tax=Dendrothele bispora (strain CBS 962.96) TaxID=1314807 RepID=A0A4S8LGK0_DENBC|nr:hypothetical protein K435DRAFT_867046 [Dendrothele bispora CBS 962.96]